MEKIRIFMLQSTTSREDCAFEIPYVEDLLLSHIVGSDLM